MLARTRSAAPSVISVAWVSALVAVALAWPSAAHAVALYGWTEGNASAFKGTKDSGLSSTKSSPYTLRLKRTSSAIKTPGGVELSSIQALSDGKYVAADYVNKQVVEFDSSGKVTWSYTQSDDSALTEPVSARRISANRFLVVDRGGARVLVVGRDKTIKFQYGGTQGTGIDQLMDPTYATFVPADLSYNTKSDTILIADAEGGHRVIEVKYDDYSASATDHGFTSSSITWQYGRAGTSGTGNNRLATPVSVQRIDANHTLITDESSHRVVVVDNKAHKPTWQFGVPNVAGNDLAHLSSPSAASYVNGAYLIADNTNKRVLRVGKSGSAVVSATSPTTAFCWAATSDGASIVANQSSGAVSEIGYVTSEERYQTKTLDLGSAGAAKWITRITVSGSKYSDTGVRVSYSINGGKWTKLGSLDKQWAKGKRATTLRLRVYLSTDDRAVSPTVSQLSVSYALQDPTVTSTTLTPPFTLTTPGLGSGITTSTSPFAPSLTDTGSALATGLAGIPTGVGPQPDPVLSGSLMTKVGTTAPANAKSSSLMVEPAGLAAVALVLGTLFGLGTASGPLAAAGKTALSAAHALIGKLPWG